MTINSQPKPSIRFSGLLAGLLCLFSMVGTGFTQTPESTKITLDAPRQVAQGEGVYSIINIENQASKQDGAEPFTCPNFDISSFVQPLSLKVQDVHGTEVQAIREPPQSAFWALHPSMADPPTAATRVPYTSIPPGAYKAFLIDLAPWLRGFPPGEYTLTLGVYRFENTQPITANPVSITITPVPQATATTQLPPAFTVLRGIAARNSRRVPRSNSEKMDAFFQQMMRAESVSTWPHVAPGSFEPHLTGYLKVLEYEHAGRTRPADEVESLRKQLLKEYPQWSHRIQAADEKFGTLQMLSLARKSITSAIE